MQERFADFRARMRRNWRTTRPWISSRELAGQHGKVTLLYAAKDPDTNHARVLLEFLAARGE